MRIERQEEYEIDNLNRIWYSGNYIGYKASQRVENVLITVYGKSYQEAIQNILEPIRHVVKNKKLYTK